VAFCYLCFLLVVPERRFVMRSDVLDDRTVVQGAMSADTNEVVNLGPKEAQVYLAIVEEYETKGGPLSAVRAAEITTRIAPSANPYVMLNGLETKGALQASEETSRNRLRIPRTHGVTIKAGHYRHRVQIYPRLEVKTDVAQQTEVVETAEVVKKAKRDAWVAPEGSVRIAEGAFVLPSNSPPIELFKTRAKVYEGLLDLFRGQHFGMSQPPAIHSIIQNAGIKNCWNFVLLFEQELPVLVRQGPKKHSCLRAIVFRPYIVNGELCVPHECEHHPDAFKPATKEVQEVQEEQDEIRIPSRKALERKVTELREKLMVRRDEAAQAKQSHQASLDLRNERIETLREQLNAEQIALAQEVNDDPSVPFTRQADALSKLLDAKKALLDNYDSLIAALTAD